MQCELLWSLVTLTSQRTQTFHIWHLTFDINSPPDTPAHTLGSWQGHSKVVRTTQPGNWPLKTDNKSNSVTDWKKNTVKNNYNKQILPDWKSSLKKILHQILIMWKKIMAKNQKYSIPT